MQNSVFWLVVVAEQTGLSLTWLKTSKTGFLAWRPINQQRHEISNNVVCVTSKASNQPAHTRSLIRAFDGHLNIL